MLKVLKPFAGPFALVAAEVGAGMSGYTSQFWGGVLMGVAGFWFVMALFGNKPLLKKMPWLLEWMPFLDPIGGMRSEARELTGRYISGHTFNITDVVHNARIIGRHFEDCDIYGPAVLAPTGIGHFVECSFYGPLDAIFLVINQKMTLGPIQLDGCTFKRCRFHGIGFVGSQTEKEMFVKGANSIT